ncbi:formyltetrahydrofolate deformylase [Microbacterium sp.]|uniref:formyltetrahydrofolate deformylase n=1 Tax=Microbacterium sp. TaxID=51671 RepID=UPI0031FF2224|nr:formyltetrahydrofolate deformylase [Microbacterium sp.]
MTGTAAARELILTLSCPDRRGIVAGVAGLIAERGGNIIDSHQFGDPDHGVFFMRIHFAAPPETVIEDWHAAVQPLADELAMTWELHDVAVRPRLLVLVSREGHCLNDLLYRWRTGGIRADIVAVASAHDDFADLAATYGLPYHRLPGPGPGTDAATLDRAVLELVEQGRADLVVLARYMQILGPDACAALTGRAINIHHSFLPSFKGAGPYRQAHERGVKLIGATAHYVTEQLDEGPIIEQEVARVDHSHSVAELARVGRDVECVALARAVRWHVERRVLLHGQRTVVFR